MGGADALEESLPGVAPEQFEETRAERVVADFAESLQFVEDRLDGPNDCSSFVLPEGFERILVGASGGPECLDGADDLLANGAIEAVDLLGPLTAAGVPPGADFVDENAGGKIGPDDTCHVGSGECFGGGGELGR